MSVIREEADGLEGGGPAPDDDVTEKSCVDPIWQERYKKNAELVARCREKAEEALDEAVKKVAWPDNALALVKIAEQYTRLAEHVSNYG